MSYPDITNLAQLSKWLRQAPWTVAQRSAVHAFLKAAQGYPSSVVASALNRQTSGVDWSGNGKIYMALNYGEAQGLNVSSSSHEMKSVSLDRLMTDLREIMDVRQAKRASRQRLLDREAQHKEPRPLPDARRKRYIEIAQARRAIEAQIDQLRAQKRVLVDELTQLVGVAKGDEIDLGRFGAFKVLAIEDADFDFASPDGETLYAGVRCTVAPRNANGSYSHRSTLSRGFPDREVPLSATQLYALKRGAP